MKSTELRIGNYLQDKATKTLLKVIELTEKGIITYVIDRSKFPLAKGWGLEPIPLTEEILLKCGFGKSDEHEMGHNYNESFGFYYDYHFKRFRLECDDGIKHGAEMDISIHFLHQLQNLYFALTNEELTVNL